MPCDKIYNFIAGTSITLPAGPCRGNAAGPADDGRRLSILRPDAEALALIERHRQMLMRLKVG